MHSPIRWAEKAAFLDMLSNGRVEFGTGRSSTWNELGGFNANVDDTKKTWDEFCRVIPKMWTEERFSLRGHVFLHARALRAAETGAGSAPAAVGGGDRAPGTEFDAADRGMGALILSISDVERNIPRIQRISRAGAALREGRQPSLTTRSRSRTGCTVTRMQGPTRSSAALELDPDLRLHGRPDRRDLRGLPGEQLQGAGPARLAAAGPRTRPATAKKPPASGLCFGDPAAHHRDRDSAGSDAGADQLIFMVQAREHLPQADVLESLRLFASEVMPRFAGDATRAAVTA